jgi:hypothetical protein
MMSAWIMPKTKNTLATSKHDHGSPDGFTSAASLLQSLMATRKLLKDLLEDCAVASAFDLVGKAAQTGENEERLRAVSILGKAAEISKPIATFVLPLLEAGLRLPLPSTASWGTADDRYYLAKGISVCREPWVTSYAAVELARADVAERTSRAVWADIAINRAQSLASALEAVARALSEDRRASDYTVDTASRKLNRIADALRKLLPIADVPTGEGFGTAFSGLVAEAGGHTGPENRPLRQETALNILDLMVQTLRLRFAATLDSDVYHAAGTVLGWWKPARPPEAVNSWAERIARIAMDSLHTLSRQGVSQRNLRQALVSAFGADLVNRIGAEIISRDPSLDPAIASWLSQGRALAETRSNTAVREVNDQEFDVLVARLLLAIDNQEGGPQSLQLMADDIELLEPGHSATIRAGIMRARLVAQWARAIGTRRRLVLSGERGELVQYDPAVHETEDDLQLSARARIKVPGVVKQQESRPAKVILKGLVEKP